MDLLLDTHTVIWFFESDSQLSEKAKQLIEDPNNQSYFSVASIWEMVIKESVGKLSLSKPIYEIVDHIQQNGIKLLPIVADHSLKVRELNLHHKDPFDRLIIAQGLLLNYPIVSKDQLFDKYISNRYW